MAGGRSWIKYGCIGCAAFVGLGMLIAGAVVGTAFLKVKSESVVEQVLTPEIPMPEPAAESSEPSQAGVELASLPQTGRIVLDLRQAGFYIEPARPGEPLRIEADYDESSYLIEESFEPGTGSGWVYRLSCRAKGSWMVNLLWMALGGQEPEGL